MCSFIDNFKTIPVIFALRPNYIDIYIFLVCYFLCGCRLERIALVDDLRDLLVRKYCQYSYVLGLIKRRSNEFEDPYLAETLVRIMRFTSSVFD